jgi:uncharacterized protein
MSADATAAGTNEEVARAFLEAILKGDPATIRATLHDDAVLVLPRPTLSGTTIRGGDNLADALADLGTQYASTTPTLGALVASDRHVIAEWRLTGTIVATGGPYDQYYVWVFDLADGLITEIREYQDTKYGYEVMAANAQGTLDAHAEQSAS